jgi:D-serine deaminase-like pyridoxal phosphate-dependent protein
MRPSEASGGHAEYFAGLDSGLRAQGIDRPVLVIDLDRLDRNIARVVQSAGKARRFRIAVKSVPSPGLVDYIIQRSGSDAGMVFDRQFTQAMARLRPQSDLLLGKPMPVAALAMFYAQHRGAFDPAHQLQWLVDTPERLVQYRDFAKAKNLQLQINFEIDVGLHRGGLADPAALASALHTLSENTEHLKFSGFMGYDGHLIGLPSFLASKEIPRVKQRYAALFDVLHRQFPQLAQRPLTFNGAGSPSFRFHETDSPLNDISVGSVLMKPTHYDLPVLEDFEASAFIATPVLKRGASTGVPTLEWMQGPMHLWDRNTADTVFIHSGNWMAEPVSPVGMHRAGIYTSSNQEAYYAARGVTLAVDDFFFLRPTQSETVLLQFGDLVGVRAGRIEQRWPVIAVGA